MKPMLAATPKSLDDLEYPVYASAKLDGVRGIVDTKGVLHSRSLKTFGNPFVQDRFSHIDLAGLDGEMILGEPFAKDVYRVTNGACSRHTGTPDVHLYVFDCWIEDHDPFEERLKWLRSLKLPPHVRVLPQLLVRDEAKLLKYEEQMLDAGYEGLILRSPHRSYKFGRSTVSEEGMLKVKRFTDSEAEVIGVEEELHNANEAKRNELGRTERSSAQAGMVPTGRMGALVVRDLVTGVEFKIGTGFTAEDREEEWNLGDIVKYKSFAIGVKDKPRFPVFLGRRMKEDM